MIRFMVPKFNDTYFSDLQAYGLSYLLSCLINNVDSEDEDSNDENYVLIRNKNSHFEITIPDSFEKFYQEDIIKSLYYTQLTEDLGIDVTDYNEFYPKSLFIGKIKKETIKKIAKIAEYFLRKENSKNFIKLINKYKVENMMKILSGIDEKKYKFKKTSLIYPISPTGGKAHRNKLGELSCTPKNGECGYDEYFLAIIGFIYFSRVISLKENKHKIYYVYTPERLKIKPSKTNYFPDNKFNLFLNNKKENDKEDTKNYYFTPIDVGHYIAMAHDILKKSIFVDKDKDEYFGNIKYMLLFKKSERNVYSPLTIGTIYKVNFNDTQENINFRNALIKILQDPSKKIHDVKKAIADWVIKRDLESLIHMFETFITVDVLELMEYPHFIKKDFPPTEKMVKELIAMSNADVLVEVYKEEALYKIGRMFKDLCKKNKITGYYVQVKKCTSASELSDLIDTAIANGETINGNIESKKELGIDIKNLKKKYVYIPPEEYVLEVPFLVEKYGLENVKKFIVAIMMSRYNSKKKKENDIKEE